MTLAEFERMPKEDAYRVELARGFVIREPRPAPLHARVQIRLGYYLEAWSREARLGGALSDGGFVLQDVPPTVRGPDLAWVSQERMPVTGYTGSFWHIAPDLAVEILSPHDRPAAVHEKVIEYLAAGVRLVWIVDPAARTVTIHAADGSSRRVAPDGALDGDEVLPGFRLSLRDLFML
jgi:Uma2 family endonuclease